jgi:hypothetical protein
MKGEFGFSSLRHRERDSEREKAEEEHSKSGGGVLLAI